MRTTLVIASLAALCACGPTPARKASLPAGGDSAAAPMRRSGLWEQSLVRDGAASRFMGRLRYCTDPAKEARLTLLGGSMGRRTCAERKWARTPLGYSFRATCGLPGGGVIVSRGALTGDLNRAYHLHVESDASGAPFPPMNGRHVTDIAATYLGPCPAGVAPGDVLLGNGMKIDTARLGLGGNSSAG